MPMAQVLSFPHFQTSVSWNSIPCLAGRPSGVYGGRPGE